MNIGAAIAFQQRRVPGYVPECRVFVTRAAVPEGEERLIVRDRVGRLGLSAADHLVDHLVDLGRDVLSTLLDTTGQVGTQGLGGLPGLLLDLRGGGRLSGAVSLCGSRRHDSGRKAGPLESDRRGCG